MKGLYKNVFILCVKKSLWVSNGTHPGLHILKTLFFSSVKAHYLKLCTQILWGKNDTKYKILVIVIVCLSALESSYGH